jgi:hypothetical protein
MSIPVAQKKRGRPKTGESPRVAFRLDPDIVARVEAIAAQEDVTFSEAIRRLVEKGLADSE